MSVHIHGDVDLALLASRSIVNVYVYGNVTGDVVASSVLIQGDLHGNIREGVRVHICGTVHGNVDAIQLSSPKSHTAFFSEK